MTDWVFGRIDAVSAWRDLAEARVNYTMDEVREPAWAIDTHRVDLPAETPGPPEPGGCWEQACRLMRDYEFSPPEIVRALYHPDTPLRGRDMLLEARFYGMHFYFGVRVTAVVDEVRGNGDRVWGWAYETLEGHLERGRVSYEVIKHHDTGRVEFVALSYSQRAPNLGPVMRLGWEMFGRRMQLRFYRRCGHRMRAFVEAILRGERIPARPPVRVGPLVFAPSDARVHRLDALAFHQLSPSWSGPSA